MAIADTIENIKSNLTNAYDELESKGATIPTNKNIENLADTIGTISGGGEDTLTAFQNNTLETLTDTSDVIPYKYYGKSALKNVDIQANILLSPAIYLFYGCSSIESGIIKLSGNGSVGNYAFYEVGKNATNNSTLKIETQSSFWRSLFQYAKADEVYITSTSLSIKATNAYNMFNGCQINKVVMDYVTTLGPFNSAAYAMGYGSNIGRMYLPNLSTISSYGLIGLGKTFLKQANCSLSSTTNDIDTKTTIFIPYTAIDNYSQATNWTSLFTNDGTEETKMFVWEEFTSGDALPAQIGTTQVYNVTWYEDDEFKTLASSTATSDKEYYGKISAVV